jgi:hypothetical protein
MINLKRILVPTDFSESARHALTYAVSFAREYKAEIVLLHVVENLTVGYASDLFPVPMAEVFEEISGYAKIELGKLAAEVRSKGAEVREQVIQGKPSSTRPSSGPPPSGCCARPPARFSPCAFPSTSSSKSRATRRRGRRRSG